MLNLSTYQKIYNKLRWYLQPPQRFIFTNLSEACCEAKPRPSPEPSPEPPDLTPHRSLPHLLRNLRQNPVECDLALHQSLPDLLRNLLRNLLQNPVECDLTLQQSLPDLLRNLRNLLLNLTRRLHQCTPELFWAEDPSSLRCWGKIGL